jgi:hypothetical protein
LGMAQLQKTGMESAETGEVFIRFLMMQQHQALLALGRHPNPPPGVPPRNLALAKVFLEQLEMVRVKTAGNLAPAEAQVLETVLTSIRAGYAEESKKASDFS